MNIPKNGLNAVSGRYRAEYDGIVPFWNDPKYGKAALAKKIGKPFPAIAKRIDRLRELLDTVPELIAADLPVPVVRDKATGDILPVHEEELVRLREWGIDRDLLRKAKGIIVTAAQFSGELRIPVFQSLKRYADFRGFPLVVLPIKYGPVHVDGEGNVIGSFPEELKGMILSERFRPIPSIELNPLRMRPTLERFLSDSVCAVGAEVSQVFAAPAFELEHRPRVGKQAGDRYPKAIMTTGAITDPNYRRDNLGQQDRTGEIATANHSYGAVIVEFASDRKTFHFRQLVSGKSGRFYDIGPKGVVSVTPQEVTVADPKEDPVVSAIVFGDWHTGLTDSSVRKATFFGRDSLVSILRPEHGVLQDFVDMFSVNPFDRDEKRGHMPLRVLKEKKGWNCLLTEFMRGVKEIEWMMRHSHKSMTLHYLPSNHPEFAHDFISSGAWIRDVTNAEVGAELFLAWIRDLRKSRSKREIRDFDPVGYYLKELLPEPLRNRMRFHQRKGAVIFPDKVSPKKRILVLHGDIGMSGRHSRGFREFRKQNIRVILGHNHSAMIWGPVWRVGVSTPSSLHYVRNPSTAWTNTHCVVFKTGQRMLVNIVNGKWHGQE